MKVFRFIGMALIAMTLSFNLSSCDDDDDDDNFIEVDHSKDLVGTWTGLNANIAVALEISADGSLLSTGVENGEYWENAKGTVEVENNKIEIEFEDEDYFEGRFEIIPGEAFSVIDDETGERFTFRYCKKDLSKEIVGMWVCTDTQSSQEEDDMMILTFNDDNTTYFTGYFYETNGFGTNYMSTYKVIGDLLIHILPEEVTEYGLSRYSALRLAYTPDGTAYGDIMSLIHRRVEADNEVEYTIPYLRVKQYLELPGQKYDFIKTYVTNVKGLDKDIPFMGYNFNFAKMNSANFDKFLKTILFNVEFPSADSIKYSCMVEGAPMSMTCPIEVDGNKMTVKMSKRYAAYRDIDFYTFQDKDNTQMHMYMPTYTFENFFSNIQVGVMASRGELDLNDAEAVEAVHKSIADAVETINISFIMTK